MSREMPINVFEILDGLKQERYRTLILHSVPEKSPFMSRFSQKLCERSNGKYLDLLEFFIQSSVLSERIDSYNPENLRELLIEQSKNQSLLVVDRADFLLDTWHKSERQNFYRFINNQWDSFKEGMKSTLVMVLQTSQEIEALEMVDSQKQSRIFRLDDFMDIV